MNVTIKTVGNDSIVIEKLSQVKVHRPDKGLLLIKDFSELLLVKKHLYQFIGSDTLTILGENIIYIKFENKTKAQK